MFNYKYTKIEDQDDHELGIKFIDLLGNVRKMEIFECFFLWSGLVVQPQPLQLYCCCDSCKQEFCNINL